MTKFHLIAKDVMVPDKHHIVIPFGTYLLINLTDEELQNNGLNNIVYPNLRYWSQINRNHDKFKFLISKHIYINVIYTVYIILGGDKGINIFELDEYDLMYIKLMGWDK